MNEQTFAEQIAVVQARHHEREKELLELLRRLDGHICHHSDCVSWQDDNYCDCAHPDLLDELAKELES